jgi:NAD(P)-dependent dehydrogenase (short-subunit alcohol dehydrogenase family)
VGTLDGRVAVVTGAGAGLGRAHALLLAAEGAQVVVNDLRNAKEVAEEIAAAGGQAVPVDGDVADMSVGRQIVDAAVESFGDLHVVVNNAGFIRDALIVNMTEEQFDAILAVHLKGTFAVTKAAAVYWRDQAKQGATSDRSVINTTSGAGLHGNVGQFNYSAAKAGSAMMAVTLAAELKRFSVRANAVAPVAATAPVLSTPGIGEMIGSAPAVDGFDRFDPANTSPLVGYLATAGCRFTGQVFSVYGGHVGLYRGWSIEHQVDQDRRWTVAELADALAGFPAHVKANRQRIEIPKGAGA